MKYLLTILLVAVSFSDLDRIARINKIKKEAKEAYNAGDYEIAAKKYSYLLDSMSVDDDNVKLNLANAYYQLRDTTGAVNNYNDLLESDNNLVKSVAHQQLGIMSNRDKKIDEALDHFKQALRADPSNEDARYNYELLKKLKKEQEEQQKQNQQQNKDKNQDQENKDQEQQKNDQNQPGENEENKDKQEQENQKGDQENKDQQEKGKSEEEQNKEGKEEQEKQQKEEEKKGDKSEEGEEAKQEKGKQDQMNSLADKLKEMNISPEKAKMILEAMRNNEIQYLQQNKRKPSKRKDPGKPDW